MYIIIFIIVAHPGVTSLHHHVHGKQHVSRGPHWSVEIVSELIEPLTPMSIWMTLLWAVRRFTIETCKRLQGKRNLLPFPSSSCEWIPSPALSLTNVFPNIPTLVPRDHFPLLHYTHLSTCPACRPSSTFNYYSEHCYCLEVSLTALITIGIITGPLSAIRKEQTINKTCSFFRQLSLDVLHTVSL